MNEKEQFVLDHYEIYPDGKVFSKFTNKFLKFRIDKDGYYDVPLVFNKNGNRMPFRVHRLVLLKYKERPIGCNIANHKDLNKQNNNLENLEWSTIALNTQHGYDNCAYHCIKRVKTMEPDGEIKVFPSISHASRFYNYKNPSGIQAILEGRSKNPINRGFRKGLYFEYTSESVTTIERNPNTIVGV